MLHHRSLRFNVYAIPVLLLKLDPAYNPKHLTLPPVRPQWENRDRGRGRVCAGGWSRAVLQRSHSIRGRNAKDPTLVVSTWMSDGV